MAKTGVINRQTLRIFWHASAKYRWLAAGSLLFTVGSFFSAVAIPYFASRALASAVTTEGNFTTAITWLLVAVVIAITTNRIGFNSAMKLIASVMHDLQHNVMTTLMYRGIRFHTNVVGGKLVSDALDFVTAYNMIINTIFMSGLSLAINIILGLAIVTLGSWQIGLYMLVVVLVTLAWAYAESVRRSGLRTRRLRATKALTSHLSDSIVNAQTVKTFAAEEREIAHDNSLSRTLRDMRISDWQRAGSSGNNRVGFLLVALVGLLIIFHLLSQQGSDILAAGIFAFTYILTLILRLFDINTMTRQTEEALLQASPMTQIFMEDFEIVDTPGASRLQVTNGAVQFDTVDFQYQDNNNKEAVFEQLSLSIKPGERVGLVGPSGGGKTTLTRLLLRFEDIQAGSITIDGQNICDITQDSLRNSVSYVPQEPLLFHRSVRENIAYGRPDATDDEIARAANLAHAHGFINKLPQKYDTVVGERGVKLSGGQRQRVAIARAILKNAPLLVLDEATSALDSESEKAIQAAMWELMKNKTALVIAHRLSTIQKMDRILVMDDGKIVEEGSHKELVGKKDGVYAKLWAHQSGGFIED